MSDVNELFHENQFQWRKLAIADMRENLDRMRVDANANPNSIARLVVEMERLISAENEKLFADLKEKAP